MTMALETLRTNLIALVGSLLPGYNVKESLLPGAWWAVAYEGGVAVVVSYGGKPKRGEGATGTRVKQDYVYRFMVAVCGENWAAPAGASYEAADVAEILFGSPNAPPGTPNLRNQSIGSINGEAVYLTFVDESPQAAPNSQPDGGRFAWIQTWETTEVRM